MTKPLAVVHALAACALLAGCATTTGVPLQLTHPSEINMTPYKQVVIGEFRGNMAEDFVAAVKEALVESGLFKVLDRAQMSQILGEQTFSTSDLADSKRRLRLGKLLTGAALITGRVDGDYDERDSHQPRTCEKLAGKDSQGKKVYQKYDCTLHVKTGRAATSGNVDVVSVETGEIIKSKTLAGTCEARTQAEGAYPESPDSRVLRACAQRSNVAVFLKAVKPWSETVIANFHKDSSVPSWETGIRHLQIGDLPAAISEFRGAQETLERNPAVNARKVAKAYANLGLAHKFAGNFDQASAAFQKAFTLSGDQRYILEKDSVSRMKREKDDLAKQSALK
jgi:curli biogenesis system outer membrane secretion channel CsgG